jgi:hypothetical protein
VSVQRGKERVFQKTPHIIPKLETVIQSQIEAICKENLTRVLNNFVPRLHILRDLRGHQMKHASV